LGIFRPVWEAVLTDGQGDLYGLWAI
jgi:hypothetical protein